MGCVFSSEKKEMDVIDVNQPPVGKPDIDDLSSKTYTTTLARLERFGHVASISQAPGFVAFAEDATRPDRLPVALKIKFLPRIPFSIELATQLFALTSVRSSDLDSVERVQQHYTAEVWPDYAKTIGEARITSTLTLLFSHLHLHTIPMLASAGEPMIISYKQLKSLVPPDNESILKNLNEQAYLESDLSVHYNRKDSFTEYASEEDMKLCILPMTRADTVLGLLLRQNNDRLTEDEADMINSLLHQFIAVLFVVQMHTKFTHYDTHLNNVFVKYLDEKDAQFMRLKLHSETPSFIYIPLPVVLIQGKRKTALIQLGDFDCSYMQTSRATISLATDMYDAHYTGYDTLTPTSPIKCNRPNYHIDLQRTAVGVIALLHQKDFFVRVLQQGKTAKPSELGLCSTLINMISRVSPFSATKFSKSLFSNVEDVVAFIGTEHATYSPPGVRPKTAATNELFLTASGTQLCYTAVNSVLTSFVSGDPNRHPKGALGVLTSLTNILSYGSFPPVKYSTDDASPYNFLRVTQDGFDRCGGVAFLTEGKDFTAGLPAFWVRRKVVMSLHSALTTLRIDENPFFKRKSAADVAARYKEE